MNSPARARAVRPTNLSPLPARRKLRKSPRSGILVEKKKVELTNALEAGMDKGVMGTQQHNHTQDLFLNSSATTESSSAASTPMPISPMANSLAGSTSSNTTAQADVVFIPEIETEPEYRKNSPVLHTSRRSSRNNLVIPPARPGSALSLLGPNRGRVDGAVAKQEAKKFKQILRQRIIEAVKRLLVGKGKKKHDAAIVDSSSAPSANKKRVGFVRLSLRKKSRIPPIAEEPEEKGKEREVDRTGADDARRDSKLDLEELLVDDGRKRKLTIRKIQRKESKASIPRATPDNTSGLQTPPITAAPERPSTAKSHSESKKGSLRFRSIRRNRDREEDSQTIEGRILYHGVITSEIDVRAPHLGNLDGELSLNNSPCTSNVSSSPVRKGKEKESENDLGAISPSIAGLTGWGENLSPSRDSIIATTSQSLPPSVESNPQPPPHIGLAITTDGRVLNSRDSPIPHSTTSLPPHTVPYNPNMLPYEVIEEPEAEEEVVCLRRALDSSSRMPVKTLESAEEEQDADGGVKLAISKFIFSEEYSDDDESGGGADLEYWTASEGSSEEEDSEEEDNDDDEDD